ncbi:MULTISPECIES: polyprenol phosphomannose-dependent alpha 1,6 mannosyltransferase MptB [Nocardioides]|uniref:Alpha-1,6-mannosyltransferase/alpha-1,6-mannosyltransferase n=1 Tax=Nocardioides lianchengensis TaxID=1045774 RepID=A0A1G6TSI9_9ACTN|nr:polyprenol phosphomannose-dependent alpha 1,6 mannosyltransferase MptB [Nocardioides lianchengensis]NYG11658.1 alpha-1,6-mannosyltransferase [Nocardioides lianchengensis]SDD31991.1 alpha-1,6-mannosyltransferase/alpha-1,6-mannosyltransferase [Nocardioides lianchengensis]
MLTRGLAGSVLVLLGGLVVSTLPRSTQLLRSESLVAIRGSEAGRMVGLTVVLLGLGLLAAAWLALCRHVAVAVGEEQDDALALVRHAVVVWSAPLVIAPPLFSRDGWSYAAQGMMAHLGISPYDHGPSVLHGPVVQAVDPMWLETVTPYGPLPLVAGDFFADFTGNPWILAIGHRAVALLGLVLLAWAVPRMARWTGLNPAMASAVALASPLMLANGVGGLHNDLLMVGLMAAALVVAAERGWVGAAVLGGCAAAVKAPGGLVCLAVALVSLPLLASTAERVRRLAAVAAVSLGTLVGLSLVTGLGLGWLGGLTVPATVNTPLSLTTLVGGAFDWVARVAGTGLPNALFLDLVRQTGTLTAVGVAVWVALTWPTGRRDTAVAAVATVIGTLVVLSPVVHLWYFLWVTPFLAAMHLSRVAASGLLAASVVLGLVAPLDSSLHGAYLAIVLGSMTVAVLVPVLLLTRRARVRLDKIVRSRWLAVP